LRGRLFSYGFRLEHFDSTRRQITIPPIGSDLKHAFRGLRAAPALSAVCVFSLALGIGANVTIYSVVREMILDDLSARQPGRLVNISAAVPYGRYRELRQAGVFQDLAFGTGIGNFDWDRGSRSEVIWQVPTGANFFDVLGVSASVGRLYSQSDEGHPVAVVSDGFWRKRLQADPGAIGRPLEIAGHPYTLVGVLPRDYRSIMRRGISPGSLFDGPHKLTLLSSVWAAPRRRNSATDARCLGCGGPQAGGPGVRPADFWPETHGRLGGQCCRAR
jgi:hypothetical protein